MDQVFHCFPSTMRSTKVKTASFICVVTAIYYLLRRSGGSSIIEGQLGALALTETDHIDDPSDLRMPLAPDVDEVEFSPKIAWLMSFPNSGTSYTMSLVGRASNRSFATNYADEVTSRGASSGSLSIYPDRYEGPFWPGMSGKMLTPRPLPETFVLTKTHCGSRCMYCGPQAYIGTPEDFLVSCSSGHARLANRRHAVDVHYPAERVARAIHLIRNPFTNIISRYHQRRKNQEDKNATEWLAEHPNNATGFHHWCRALDREFYQEELEYFGPGNVSQAPCHGEFYKYAQWHSLVDGALGLISHNVPVLTVYYEDYDSKLEETTQEILNFLELELVGSMKAFKQNTEISDYFTPGEKQMIKDLVYEVASTTAWKQIHHYF